MFFILPNWAEVKLPKLLSDGMILQRNEPIKIWGSAAVGELVRIQFLKDFLMNISAKKNNFLHIHL